MTFSGKSAVSSPGAPAALGPYSQAVRVGDLLYCSGQIGLNPATGALVEGGIREQTARALENLAAILAEAGGSLNHVVKTTVFLQSMKDFPEMNAVYAAYLAPPGVVAPARSTVEAARLPKDALVEIEATARL